jgi:nicotinamidase-related amidase
MKLKLDPHRTAVLLLDVQKDLVDITPGLSANRVLEHMARVLRAARRKKCAIIHVTASVRADFLDLPKDNPLWDGLRQKRQLIIGTRGAAIDPRVKPRKNELVLVDNLCRSVPDDQPRAGAAECRLEHDRH